MKKKFEGLLAIDPGIKACGWAIFKENRYMASGLARPFSTHDLLEALKETTNIIFNKWEDFMSGTKMPDILVIEKPQIYQQKHLKGDPNDLMPLGILAGAVWIRMVPNRCVMPLPKEWKGQTPKDVMSRRTISQLDRQERDLLKDDVERIPSYLRHNVYDAIGIALWEITKRGRNE